MERPSDRLLHFSQNTHPTKNVITDVQISFDCALYNIWIVGSLWHFLSPLSFNQKRISVTDWGPAQLLRTKRKVNQNTLIYFCLQIQDWLKCYRWVILSSDLIMLLRTGSVFPIPTRETTKSIKNKLRPFTNHYQALCLIMLLDNSLNFIITVRNRLQL